MKESSGQTASRESEFIWYYRGIGIARASVGDVAVYSMAGGFNDSKGYFPHELWFSTRSYKMIWKDEIPSDTADYIDQRFRAAFPEQIDCGRGSTAENIKATSIETIKADNRAYWFARQ